MIEFEGFIRNEGGLTSLIGGVLGLTQVNSESDLERDERKFERRGSVHLKVYTDENSYGGYKDEDMQTLQEVVKNLGANTGKFEYTQFGPFSTKTREGICSIDLYWVKPYY
ncbi:hypothetical protein KY342_01585 [Candidatus Woesearchaeota archaeon]|nr:hypothetical protein [Candidatus Woesearchaeota archaeon]